MILFLTCILGVWSILNIRHERNQHNRSDLQKLVRIGAAGLNEKRIKTFTGNKLDLTNPDWLAIRNRFYAMLKADSTIRWIYLINRRDSVIFFYMDTPDDVPGNAMPGEIYDDAPTELFAVFQDKQPRTAGPYTDRWGTYISAFQPVTDPATGEMVAVLGFDIEASRWNQVILNQLAAPALVTILLMFVEVIAFMYIRRRRLHESAMKAAYHELEKKILERTRDLLRSNFELELQIHEREKTEETLRRATEELDRFFSVTLDLLCIADTSGHFRRLNIEWEKTLGYPIRELEGKKFIDFVHPDDVAPTLKVLNEMIGQREVLNFVNRYRRRDGSYRWIEWRTYLYGDMIYAAARDITGRIETLNTLKENERKFRSLAEETNDWIWEMNTEGVFTYSNPKGFSITGYSSEELIGHTPFEWMDTSDTVPYRQLFSNYILDGNVPARMEARMKTKSGKLIYLEISNQLVYDNQGNIAGLRGISRDITERKLTEIELRETKERLEYILGVTKTGIDVIDKDFNLRYVDPEWKKKYGDNASQKCYAYFRNRKEPCPGCGILRAFETKQVIVTEEILPHENNRIVEIHTIPFRNYDGEWLVAEFNIDITEHKRIEQAFRESENRYRAVMEQATEGILLFDVGTRRIIETNRSYQTMLGYTAEELMQLTAYDVILHDQHNIDLYIDKILKQNRLFIGARHHRHKLGHPVDVEVSAYLIELNAQKTMCVVVRDIRERIKAERTMKALLQRQALILQSLPVVFYTASVEGDMQTVWISEQVEEITGFKSADITSDHFFWETHLHPDEKEAMVAKYRSVLTEKEVNFEYRWRCADGVYRWFQEQMMRVDDERGIPKEIIGLWIKIDERKKAEQEKQNLEAQLQHSQKLESLGVLAGGIAHDFNNLLTSVLGYAELTQRKIEPISPAQDYLQEISKAALRASDLCRQMLAYSGRGKFIVQPIDLPAIVREMTSIIKVSLSKKIILQFHFDLDTPTVDADPSQIRQIILNLVINASEAIGDANGVITIRTGRHFCNQAFFEKTWLHDPLPEGWYVYLEVADTGCGMDEDTLTKIFDPFFTTKFSGRGLGLAAVLGIVRGHKGALQVFSEPGKGTRFYILFPAGKESVQPDIPRNEPKGQGSGSVLLADDEEPIRKLGKEILEMNGYSVDTAEDGAEAVRLFLDNPAKYRCVILDLTMPKMNGRQALQELLKIRPDILVVISSGYSENEIAKQFSGTRIAGFIQKPYDVDTLCGLMRQLTSS